MIDFEHHDPACWIRDVCVTSTTKAKVPSQSAPRRSGSRVLFSVARILAGGAASISALAPMTVSVGSAFATSGVALAPALAAASEPTFPYYPEQQDALNSVPADVPEGYWNRMDDFIQSLDDLPPDVPINDPDLR